MGRGGGQVVVVLAFHSDDPSSNLAEVFSVKVVVEKNENKQKRPEFAHLKNTGNLQNSLGTYKISQSKFKILPNTKYTLKQLPKTFEISPNLLTLSMG